MAYTTYGSRCIVAVRKYLYDMEKQEKQEEEENTCLAHASYPIAKITPNDIFCFPKGSDARAFSLVLCDTKRTLSKKEKLRLEAKSDDIEIARVAQEKLNKMASKKRLAKKKARQNKNSDSNKTVSCPYVNRN